MKWGLLAAAALFLLPSCAQVPKIRSSSAILYSESAVGCHRAFPAGDWQFVHTVKAELPGEKVWTAIGLTVISSQSRTVRCVIMTPEGLVVFDAEYDQDVTVHRAFAPFDSTEFAQGLMDDIRLIFFTPEGPLVDAGRTADGSLVCRHENPDGRLVDVYIHGDGSWELRRYSRRQRLTRTVKASPAKESQTGFPAVIEMTARSNQNYRLEMTLVQAVDATP